MLLYDPYPIHFTIIDKWSNQLGFRPWLFGIVLVRQLVEGVVVRVMQIQDVVLQDITVEAKDKVTNTIWNLGRRRLLGRDDYIGTRISDEIERLLYTNTQMYPLRQSRRQSQGVQSSVPEQQAPPRPPSRPLQMCLGT